MLVMVQIGSISSLFRAGQGPALSNGVYFEPCKMLTVRAAGVPRFAGAVGL